MKRIVFYTIISITGAFLWIILNENLNMHNFIIGFLISLFVVRFTEKFFLRSCYYDKIAISYRTYIIYPFYLIFKIYTSGFLALYLILTGAIRPKITTITTSLKDGLLISILANSITLTPGTISVDKTDGTICVLYLDRKNKCILNTYDYIVCSYEKILGRCDKK